MLIFALHLSSSLMRKYILYTHAPSLSPITHRREHAYNCLIPDIVWKPEFWEHLHRTYKPAGYNDLLPQNNGETLTLIPLNKLASIKLHIYLNPKGSQASNWYRKSSITQTKRLYWKERFVYYHINTKSRISYQIQVEW